MDALISAIYELHTGTVECLIAAVSRLDHSLTTPLTKDRQESNRRGGGVGGVRRCPNKSVLPVVILVVARVM